MKNRVAIIGAGCTGRGFVARFFDAGERVDFIDRDAALIKRLRRETSFRICFADREDIVMSGYRAFLPDAEGVRAIADANACFTSVSANCLPDVAPYLRDALKIRRKQTDKVLRVVLCENGVDVAQKILSELTDEEKRFVRIAEAAVFCTTIKKPDTALDILSESFFTLPYDAACGAFDGVEGLVPEPDMRLLMRRKIYTYNMLSACIAYAGYRKGYTDYADAANDKEIAALCDDVCDLIAPVYAEEFQITESEQRAFSGQAMVKFQNRLISDTIEKNARDVKRKLEATERIVGPMLLLKARSASTDLLATIAAYAIVYGEKEEGLTINDLSFPDEIRTEIMNAYEYLTKRRSIP